MRGNWGSFTIERRERVKEKGSKEWISSSVVGSGGCVVVADNCDEVQQHKINKEGVCKF